MVNCCLWYRKDIGEWVRLQNIAKLWAWVWRRIHSPAVWCLSSMIYAHLIKSYKFNNNINKFKWITISFMPKSLRLGKRMRRCSLCFISISARKRKRNNWLKVKNMMNFKNNINSLFHFRTNRKRKIFVSRKFYPLSNCIFQSYPIK